MFYTEKQGSITDPDNLVLEIQSIYPVDKGSSAFTGFELQDSGIMQWIMSHPELINMNQGFIHSHNTMGVFFSGTDMSELEDNCRNHNYYLSVIVNNYGDIIANVAVYVQEDYTISGTRTRLDSRGNKIEVPYSTSVLTDEMMEYYECEIVKPGVEVDEAFKIQVDKIIQDAAKASNTVQAGNQITFFPAKTKQPKVTDFIPKFIALDLNFKGFVYDAMKSIEQGELVVTHNDYIVHFDAFFDQYFGYSDVDAIDVINRILEAIKVYKSSWVKAYSAVKTACEELLTGVEDEEDEFDLANPNNVKFHGR